MYRITTPSGASILTEKVNYIRVHKSGVYLLTDVSHAEGVAHHGTPYLFKDGAQVCEVDAGADIQASQETEALALELAADHEARLCNIELGV